MEEIGLRLAVIAVGNDPAEAVRACYDENSPGAVALAAHNRSRVGTGTEAEQTLELGPVARLPAHQAGRVRLALPIAVEVDVG
jgi:hypothetical protein